MTPLRVTSGPVARGTRAAPDDHHRGPAPASPTGGARRLGPDAGLALAERLELPAPRLVRRGDTLREHATTAFMERKTG